MTRRRTIMSRVAWVLAACTAPAFAAEPGNLLEERFGISLGTFFMSSDTRVRADRFRSAEIGTTLDFEDTFGFDDEKVFRGDVKWRFFERHMLHAMYFNSDRTARERIEREIRFGDETFPAAADISAEFEFDIIELAYEYAFLHRERYELGASLGIHNVGLKLGLGTTLTGFGLGGALSIEERVRTDAPLPVFGLHGTWRLAPNLFLQAHGQYFKLQFGDYDGDIRDYGIGALWQFSRHIGVGASYNLFRTEVDANNADNFRGRLRWEYDGAQVFIRGSF
jgi:hypothetical protein